MAPRGRGGSRGGRGSSRGGGAGRGKGSKGGGKGGRKGKGHGNGRNGDDDDDVTDLINKQDATPKQRRPPRNAQVLYHLYICPTLIDLCTCLCDDLQ
jgi:hypothetical protein